MMSKFRYLLAPCLLIAFSLPAFAEKADREKPINLEADRISMDDVKRCRFSKAM